jgi:hypothetical protein
MASRMFDLPLAGGPRNMVKGDNLTLILSILLKFMMFNNNAYTSLKFK